jgi:hypothetical protein
MRFGTPRRKEGREGADADANKLEGGASSPNEPLTIPDTLQLSFASQFIFVLEGSSGGRSSASQHPTFVWLGRATLPRCCDVSRSISK